MTTIRDAVAKRDERASAFAADDGGGVLAVRPDQKWWTARQTAALKSLGIKNASDDDLLVFFHYCQKTGLDPFSKQIYMLERRTWNKEKNGWDYHQVIQVGIDGFRVNAQRAAARQGVQIAYEPTIWFDSESKRYEVWLDDDKPPAAALVTVVKVLPDGTRLPVPGLAKFESYAAYGTNKDKTKRWLQNQWATMPDHMIEKCAEAFALRRAFPNDLGGMYVEEELQGQQFEPPGNPPKMGTYQRGPQAGDDDVVDGEVLSDTEDADLPDPKDSIAKIAKVFRDNRFGAKTKADARRAVATGVYRYYVQGRESLPTEYVKLEDLDARNLAALADALEGYCANVAESSHGVPVADHLSAYAAEVDQSVQERTTTEKQET